MQLIGFTEEKELLILCSLTLDPLLLLCVLYFSFFLSFFVMLVATELFAWMNPKQILMCIFVCVDWESDPIT